MKSIFLTIVFLTTSAPAAKPMYTNIFEELSGFQFEIGPCIRSKQGNLWRQIFLRRGKLRTELEISTDCTLKSFMSSKNDEDWFTSELTEDEENGSSLAYRVHKIAGGPDVMFYTNTYGFEIVRRKHIACYVKKKLTCQKLEEDPDSGAPVFNFVEFAKSTKGNVVPVLNVQDTTGSYTQGGHDDWSMEVLAWNNKAEKIDLKKIAPGEVSAWAVILGSYKSPEDAHKQKEAIGTKMACGSLHLWLMVLSGKEYPKVKDEISFLGMVFTAKNQAEKILTQAKGCGIPGYIKTVY